MLTKNKIENFGIISIIKSTSKSFQENIKIYLGITLLFYLILLLLIGLLHNFYGLLLSFVIYVFVAIVFSYVFFKNPGPRFDYFTLKNILKYFIRVIWIFLIGFFIFSFFLFYFAGFSNRFPRQGYFLFFSFFFIFLFCHLILFVVVDKDISLFKAIRHTLYLLNTNPLRSFLYILTGIIFSAYTFIIFFLIFPLFLLLLFYANYYKKLDGIYKGKADSKVIISTIITSLLWIAILFFVFVFASSGRSSIQLGAVPDVVSDQMIDLIRLRGERLSFSANDFFLDRSGSTEFYYAIMNQMQEQTTFQIYFGCYNLSEEANKSISFDYFPLTLPLNRAAVDVQKVIVKVSSRVKEDEYNCSMYAWDKDSVISNEIFSKSEEDVFKILNDEKNKDEIYVKKDFSVVVVAD